MIYYTGIGSRETPDDILQAFTYIGKQLAKNSFTLRSGGAQGADQAFEFGCISEGGYSEIYLPWRGFENNGSLFYLSALANLDDVYAVASKHHPYWDNLSDGAKKLHARNVLQVLGQDLTTPSSFVVCYTKNGMGHGGTGQALRIARSYGIPIFDFGKYRNAQDGIEEFKKFFRELEF